MREGRDKMYGVTPDIRVRITLKRDEPVCSGYRPTHLIGDYLTTGMQIYFKDGELRSGESVEGTITFISPEAYPHSLENGMEIPFYEGNRNTGCAYVLEIYNEVMRK